MREARPRFESEISLIRDTVFFRIESRRIHFKLEDIILVGEFSAPRGAYSDDYFFVFKVRGFPEMIEVPAYTEGIFELLADLKNELPGLKNPICFTLHTHSTSHRIVREALPCPIQTSGVQIESAQF